MLLSHSKFTFLYRSLDKAQWKTRLHSSKMLLDSAHLCQETSYSPVKDINFMSAKKNEKGPR